MLMMIMFIDDDNDDLVDVVVMKEMDTNWLLLAGFKSCVCCEHFSQCYREDGE
jgi:hypothetical protein